jgi:putative hydrolase of the HAD superfamily
MSLQIRNPQAFQSRPAAVLLDLDNTVYAYAPPHREAMKAVRGAMIRNYSFPEAEFDAAFARARGQVKASLGATAASHSRLLYFKAMLEAIGLGSQLQAALNLEQLYWRMFLARIEVFAGVAEFLDELRLAAIPVAVVTDLTAQIQLRKLVYLGLDHHIDVVVTSEEVGADKPDPRLFRAALQRLGAREGSAWFIGDDPVADMQGARAAIGAVTIQKLHEGVVRAEGDAAPAATLEEFPALTALLRSLGNM